MVGSMKMRRKIDALSEVHGSEEYPDIFGNVTFKQLRSGVYVKAEIFGLPDTNGIYGFHIHEGSMCEGNDEDPFADAMGHYNPGNTEHPYHSGDMPPLFNCHGYAYMTFLTDRFNVSEIIDRTVIIHAGVDDFTSQPSGNSGIKMACGEIIKYH